MAKRKIGKIVEDDKSTIEQKAVEKPNKKLSKLKHEIATKKLEINNFLTVQGLGQNARAKTTQMFKDLQRLDADVAFEKRHDDLKKQKKEESE